MSSSSSSIKKGKTKGRKALRVILWIFIVLCLYAFLVNFYVSFWGGKKILTAEEAGAMRYDCILVLGCGVWAGGVPSHMLQDRLDTAIDLYFSGAGKKLLMSGDHGTADYNEVQVMRDYALAAGVPAEDIFMDHAGFCTYDSICRAKRIFRVESLVVVTQKYHSFRAVFLAEAFGMEAVAVTANPRAYVGAAYREAREVIARNKDFIWGILKPDPTYLGEPIPITGDGNVTVDQ